MNLTILNYVKTADIFFIFVLDLWGLFAIRWYIEEKEWFLYISIGKHGIRFSSAGFLKY